MGFYRHLAHKRLLNVVCINRIWKKTIFLQNTLKRSSLYSRPWEGLLDNPKRIIFWKICRRTVGRTRCTINSPYKRLSPFIGNNFMSFLWQNYEINSPYKRHREVLLLQKIHKRSSFMRGYF